MGKKRKRVSAMRPFKQELGKESVYVEAVIHRRFAVRTGRIDMKGAHVGLHPFDEVSVSEGGGAEASGEVKSESSIDPSIPVRTGRRRAT